MLGTFVASFLFLVAFFGLPVAQPQSSIQRPNASNAVHLSRATGQLKNEIVALERKLWDADVSGGPYQDLIAADFVGIKHGLRFDAQDDALAGKEYKLRSYTMSDERVRLIRTDVALLTYRVNWTGTFAGTELPERPFYVASIWVNQAGHWKNTFYAETQPDFATETYQRLTKGV